MVENLITEYSEWVNGNNQQSDPTH